MRSSVIQRKYKYHFQISWYFWMCNNQGHRVTGASEKIIKGLGELQWYTHHQEKFLSLLPTHSNTKKCHSADGVTCFFHLQEVPGKVEGRSPPLVSEEWGLSGTWARLCFGVSPSHPSSPGSPASSALSMMKKEAAVACGLGIKHHGTYCRK